jgi:parallel beta-helix repeat protein
LALPAATLSGVETAKVTDATVETVQPASGPRVWHVSQFGSDIAAGTQAQPLQTIQRAANLAKPGDTVVVAAGIYQGFRTVRGGTAQAPITFRGHGRGTTITSPPGDYQDNILVSATDNVIIEGFEVRDAPRAGIAILKSAGVIVRQNSVGASGKWGIFSGFAPRLEIVENETFGARLEHGIYVSNSDTADDNPVVRGNHSHHNGGSGIQLNGDCLAGGDGVLTGALVENNVVHDNAYKGLSLISIQSSVVQNNVVYDNGKKAGAAGIHLADNPGGDRPSDNNSIVNNTIVESQIAGIRITGRSSGNVVFNNLIVGPESIRDEAGANHIDESSNVLALTSAGLFVNAANGDYRLAAGGNTRARGRGAVAGKKAPTQDLDGKPRGTDVLAVGAYE